MKWGGKSSAKCHVCRVLTPTKDMFLWHPNGSLRVYWICESCYLAKKSE